MSHSMKFEVPGWLYENTSMLSSLNFSGVELIKTQAFDDGLQFILQKEAHLSLVVLATVCSKLCRDGGRKIN